MRKFYDTRNKTHIRLLGYFGGTCINISDAFKLAEEYSSLYPVPVESVVIAEISDSQRFKYNKYLMSVIPQEPIEDLGSDSSEGILKFLFD